MQKIAERSQLRADVAFETTTYTGKTWKNLVAEKLYKVISDIYMKMFDIF